MLCWEIHHLDQSLRYTKSRLIGLYMYIVHVFLDQTLSHIHKIYIQLFIEAWTALFAILNFFFYLTSMLTLVAMLENT